MSQLDSSRPVIDREIDLRGDVCPLTFAKTKIALEEMTIGQVLRVALDYEPAIRNVPKSVTMYGDLVLAVNPIGAAEWEVLIRKLID